ncbi:hypothetical protein FF1_023069 [Malus domestica]
MGVLEVTIVEALSESTVMRWMSTDKRVKAFVLSVDPSSDNDSDNEASINEQSQKGEDGLGDAKEGGDGDGVETQSDIVRGSASDDDDS